jgi:hypothetical protein
MRSYLWTNCFESGKLSPAGWLSKGFHWTKKSRKMELYRNRILKIILQKITLWIYLLIATNEPTVRNEKELNHFSRCIVAMLRAAADAKDFNTNLWRNCILIWKLIGRPFQRRAYQTEAGF